MRASKENAAEALRRINKNVLTEEDVGYIRDFLNAAERKLPREESYDRDAKKQKEYDEVDAAAKKGFHDGNR